MQRFRISKFVVQLAGPGGVALCHGPSLQRLTVAPDLAEAFELFRHGATLADLTEACGDAETAAQLIALFARPGLIVDEAFDEDAAWTERLGLTAPIAAPVRTTGALPFDKTVALERTDLAPPGAADHEPLAVALIGGCFVQVLCDFLKKAALRRGYAADVAYHWPDGVDQVRRAAAAPADLAILHPFIRPLLEPVWSAYGRAAAELEPRLAALIAGVVGHVAAFAAGLDGRLGVVHNLTAPQLSPRGRYDHGFARIVARVNAALLDACAPHRNLVVLDEEAIAAGLGKHRVLDDLHNAYSHHGHGYTSQAELPRWADPARSARLCDALVTRQLDALDAWRGRRRLKCVVTDLDGTLWPGVIGDEGIDFTRLQYAEGAHEALALLKARGVLLATCSKNDEAQTLAAWRQFAEPPYLSPDDFVLHKINWRRKSDNLVELARALGVGLDAILFVDDNPIEREEVRRALPEVTVWDGAIEDLRHDLLSEPRFDSLVATAEAARRTEMMQAQLRRDELRQTAGSEAELLQSLEIALDVARATPRDAGRLAELFQRTNQFNTSLTRYPPNSVAASIERGELWTLRARDRFTDYGLVGAIVVRDAQARVETVVLSCRVIGLACAAPFLATVLGAAGLVSCQPRATVVIGPRNQPARSVFRDAGFTAEPDGSFVLRRAADLVVPDPAIYRITCTFPDAAEPIAASEVA